LSRHFPKYAAKKAKKPASRDVSAWRQLILDHSPYLSANLDTYEDRAADAAFDAILGKTATAAATAADTAELMSILRRAKRHISTLTAIADLKGEWRDLAVTRHLSVFADFAVGAALHHLLREAHARKAIRLPDPKNPARDCSVAVIALGKWGAFELNYSSDIDLMVLFDPQKSPVKDKDETQNFFIRLTRDLARVLDQPTEDGYVFRTDLRLRPDPGAMPLAVSIDTAETYYGSLGQNWERAAMIKSRPVAGDEGLGADFMKIMSAWIWRRNLDFAAIQDIHSIKRQINAKQAQKGRAAAKGNPFLNFNVKLGHGGIREIEFFAQTQQLIYGGREPRLREPGTLAALATLAQTGHIPEEVRAQLEKSYLFLRRVEHRLQMQDDRQTHSLPATSAAFSDFSRFMEYASPEKFTADLTMHTGAVKKLYAELFTESPSLAGPGNLVFTGVEDDPETLETLRKMGFAEPARVTSAIRGWHHGRYRAVRSERARQILTELVPHLLKAFSATPHPDDAFIRFDRFLERLPSGIPIFSMFMKHPPQMELVADIMGTSPALAGHLGTHPQVLDGVLSRDFFGRLPDLAWLKEDLSRYLTSARDYQDVLDFTRRWAREKRFHAGIHILRHLSEHRRCRLYLSDIAEAALSCLVPLVEKEFAQAHGRFRTGEFMILAMGGFAAQEMFADSDLDIVALYKTDAAEKTSNGEKPLPPNVYYIRLMQRLIAALTAPTAEGILYEVDARLRPAGEKGPIAAQMEGFFDYQRKDAWVWEHMSLIRSRLVYAAPKTAAAFSREIEKILSAPRDEKKLRHDMLDMRARVEKQFGSKDDWNMKYRRGGIMDIMFAVHFLVLQHAEKHSGLLHPSLEETLKRLQAQKLLSKRDAAPLLRALQHAQDVQSYLRLAAELPFDPEKAPPGLGNALAASVTGKKKAAFKPFAAAMKKDFAASYAAYKRILK
jgi:[glutamine synthetase] adenylyltransferase / [glutamine synthetase]-adenylyl-L-tyrosine phosphorylase